MLARCPSNDQQIMYSEVRMDDIRHLTTTNVEGIEISNILRIFKGDAPACQFEAGHQKGGHYFCWACGMHAERSKELVHIFNLSHTSLQQKLQSLSATIYGRNALNKKYLHYTDNISKVDIIADLHEREVKLGCENKKDALLKMLDRELKGSQRAPALLYASPNCSLSQSGLANYEILPCEPLHCIAGHLKNLYHELPFHLNKNDRKLFETTVAASFSGKEAKRAADYRLSLVDCTNHLHGKVDQKVFEVLETACEIQEIMYSPEQCRTPTSILRLHNTTFLHALALNEVIKSPKSLTKRKLYGQYYHSLIAHAPEQYRIFSGPTTNTENEERSFNFLKVISSQTSNHHPANVILNAFLRLQVKEENSNHTILSGIESKISKHSNGILSRKRNTIIPYHVIEKHPWTYQAHLERIADYLVTPQFWKEADSGIEFFDTNEALNTTKKTHHFRQHTIETEKEFLKLCWEKYLSHPEKIPAFKIKIENKSDATLIKFLDTISFASTMREETTLTEPATSIDAVLASSPMNTSILDFSSHHSETPMTPLTSTPKAAPTIPKELPSNRMISLKKVHTTEMSKTANLLVKILGDCKLVSEYDNIRKCFKTHPNMYRQQLCQLSAQIEVKLVVARNNIKKQLKETEMKLLQSQKGIDIVSKNEEDQMVYNKNVKKLSIITQLKSQFNL
ncbi:uncharacterized protein LOC130656649 [Hydractinia symbiolongicarpus]|uniref:uncharacterized protein LOC130656649 n=1 Tax=Hydractinia symbiolongicarpus TaxID=13093 RepID=UPI00254AA0B0|nr:uncharacterized protein LOC130656649 [Hydractinia symbiolongicarpus]